MDILRKVINLLYERPSTAQPSERRVVYTAVSGPVGSGKTYVSELVCQEAKKMGIPASKLSLDAYLMFSTSQRKTMLEDAEQTDNPDLRSLATNQLKWYDFNTFVQDLSALRDGFAIRRNGVYSKRSGEFDGELLISTEELLRRSNGLSPMVVVDGQFILHNPVRSLLDLVVYLHSDDAIRLERMKQRDSHRRTPEEIERQFQIAYASQMPYFRAHPSQVNVILLNNGKLEMFNGPLTDLI